MRPDGWLAHIVDRQADFSGRFWERWDRFTEGTSRRRGSLAYRFRDWWYRSTDAILCGRDNLADRFWERWNRFTDPILRGRDSLAERSDGRIGHGVLTGTQTLLAASLSVMLVVAVITLIRAAGGTQRASTKADSTGPTEAALPAIDAPAGHEASGSGKGRSGLEVYVNAQAGYTFSFPDSWQLSRSEETARLVSSDGGVVMVFGVAPPGPLEEASVRVVESLTDTYRNAKLVTGEIERTPGGIRFLTVGGKASHATGAPVRFLVIIIQGPDENQAITVRFSSHSDPLDALPAIRKVIASYKTFVA